VEEKERSSSIWTSQSFSMEKKTTADQGAVRRNERLNNSAGKYSER
jgi:hypothetical protein